MVNKVILLGNLGRDPEVRHLEGNISVASFPVATNENYRDRSTGEWKKDTEWHDVVAWRYLAERAEKQLKKGSLVYIEGKIKTRKWQDKEGNDRYSTEVVANRLLSLDRGDTTGQERNYGQDFPSVRAGTDIPAATGDTASATSDKGTDDIDDLPF